MLVAPPVVRYLRAAQPTAPVALRSVRVCVPVGEVAAVVRCGDRIRAVAARFEQDSGGWRCVAFRIL
jgi:hypothetical protein